MTVVRQVDACGTAAGPGYDVPSKLGSWADLSDDFRSRIGNGDKELGRRLPTDPLCLANASNLNACINSLAG
jgi:hypothetical protein